MMRRLTRCKRILASTLLVGTTTWLPFVSFAHATSGIVPEGAGSYTTIQPANTHAPQSMIYRTANVTGPMPTDKWWSSAAWLPYSDTMYPNPFQITAVAAGLQVNDPAVTANSGGIFSDPASYDFTLGSTASTDFPSALVDGYSDWTVSLLWDDGSGGTMRVTSGEGMPYLDATYAGGNPTVTFSGTPTVYSGNAASSVLGVTINGHDYGLFAPTGATWSGIGTADLVCNLPSGTDYFSVATLPDSTSSTLQEYAQYAYSFVTGTSVSYSVNQSTSQVDTTYNFATEAMQGSQSGTIAALYPAQWENLTAGTSLLPYTYASVHGTMKTLAGPSFSTVLTYHGILPYLPPVGNYNASTLDGYIQSVVNESSHYTFGTDTYGEGKAFGRIAQIIPLAQSVGDTSSANNLLNWLETNIANSFVATDSTGAEKTSDLFWYDPTWGTLIGYPSAYGSATDLNDHSFHYGYWVHAAAQIALDDPSWASQSQWGAMVNMMIKDYGDGNTSSSMFPFLRSFDPYAGHSWTSGNAEFNDGNNLESSSEAIQAWAAMIEWGAATDQPAIENLGIYLYTTEVTSVLQYWFNVDGTNFPSSYPNDYTAMQWGGKSVYATWFSSDPEQIRGINILPVTGSSLYLGLNPTYDQQFMQQLVSEYGSDNWKVWPDILWEFQAFYDPTGAINLFNADPSYTPEQGESEAHTYSWLYDMQKLGEVNSTITANTPLYAVFTSGAGNTYVADNPAGTTLVVTFSDGTTLDVPPYSMAWTGVTAGTLDNHTGVTTTGSTGTTGTGSGSGSGTGTGSTAAYSQSITASTTSSAQVTFTPTQSAEYVILHYVAGGQSQQNVQMSASGSGWTYTIPGLSAGESVAYSFTYNEGGVQTDTSQYSYTFGPAPVVSSLSPSSGAPGVSVTLSGSDFGSSQGSSSVDFGTTAATVQSWSANSIVVTVPDVSAGSTNVTVTVGGQTSAPVAFTVDSTGTTGGNAAYTESFTEPTGSTGLVSFTPSQTAEYVILHYTVGGGTQQNVQMSASGNAWQYTISGLASGETIVYSFTYNENGVQTDTSQYQSTF